MLPLSPSLAYSLTSFTHALPPSVIHSLPHSSLTATLPLSRTSCLLHSPPPHSLISSLTHLFHPTSSLPHSLIPCSLILSFQHSINQSVTSSSYHSLIITTPHFFTLSFHNYAIPSFHHSLPPHSLTPSLSPQLTQSITQSLIFSTLTSSLLLSLIPSSMISSFHYSVTPFHPHSLAASFLYSLIFSVPHFSTG